MACCKHPTHQPGCPDCERAAWLERVDNIPEFLRREPEFDTTKPTESPK